MNFDQASKRPLISVLLNSFNSERFISQQIDSILAQTYTNFELVICDNHSTDRTADIVAGYIQKDPRVKWIQNESNLGISLSFQKGLRLCVGELIAPSDSDDFWLPGKLETQLAYLQSHPATDLVFTDSMIVNDDLSLELGSFQKKLGNPFCGESISIQMLLKRNLVPLHTVMFRSALISKILPLPLGYVHDSWIALVSSMNCPLGFIDQCTVRYRQHAANTVGAWVRGSSFYLKQCNDPAFIMEYFIGKADLLVGFQRLLGIRGGEAARHALKEKIINQEALFAVLRATSFWRFVCKLFKAAWVILKSRQKYHLKQLFFLAFCWRGIRKLRLSGETFDISILPAGYKRWGEP